MKTKRAQGLRRKARQLHRQADVFQSQGKVWDATVKRQQARELEQRAEEGSEAVSVAQSLAPRRRWRHLEDADIPVIRVVAEAEDFYGVPR